MLIETAAHLLAQHEFALVAVLGAVLLRRQLEQNGRTEAKTSTQV